MKRPQYVLNHFQNVFNTSLFYSLPIAQARPRLTLWVILHSC